MLSNNSSFSVLKGRVINLLHTRNSSFWRVFDYFLTSFWRCYFPKVVKNLSKTRQKCPKDEFLTKSLLQVKIGKYWCQNWNRTSFHKFQNFTIMHKRTTFWQHFKNRKFFKKIFAPEKKTSKFCEISIQHTASMKMYPQII